MRRTDRWAIDEQGIPSLELMEAAGRALAEVAARIAPGGPIRVVCGKGNNGGDGLVAARLLGDLGYDAAALLLGSRGELEGDVAANAARIGALREVEAEDLAGELAGSAAVVDALLGTGFSGRVREPMASAIRAIDECGAPVVACDIPSGVDGASGEVTGEAVHARATVTFHGPKVGHAVRPGKDHAGELILAPIGIPDGSPVLPEAGLIDEAVLAEAPLRGAASTKFSSGNVVVVGGSRGLTGAVCLAAEAAGRAGAGYVTAVVPADLEYVFEVKLTETMTVGCPAEDGAFSPAALDDVLAACGRAGAVVLGSGLGRTEGAFGLARDLVERTEAPLVIDADGLNALAGRLETLRDRRGAAILTPHEGELGRLLERDSSDVAEHRLASAREAAGLSGAVVVLKGDDTIVTDGERVAVNGLSSPGLATAGTGDVLAGTTGALVARGMTPFAAACAAVVGNARAGLEAAQRQGLAEGVIAGDVIAALPAGLRPSII
jgi:NAD(P)H-hydrate epimerase